MAHVFKTIFYINFIFIIIFSKVSFKFLNEQNNEQSQKSPKNEEIKVNKTLILYAYYERNPAYVHTFKFFIEFGLFESDDLEYIFIIQGGQTNVTIPNYKNVRILKRPNDCFDFGAYGKAIEWLGGLDAISQYKAFIFINPSAIGPILPKYWPKEIKWTQIYTERLVGDVHLVGSSLTCRVYPKYKEFGPRVEGYAFAASSFAVELAFQRGVFKCHLDKMSSIFEGEFKFSRIVLENNLNLDSLLLKYGRINWKNKKNWKCNALEYPSRLNTYDGDMSIHPLEIVFHKSIWIWKEIVFSTVYHKEVLKYMKWARDRRELETKEINAN
jgi:hypothetical protein